MVPDGNTYALLALLIILLILGGTFLHHLFLGVPFVPTPNRAVWKMLELARLRAGDKVLDLGAGDGRFLIAAKRACPGITATGYEMVPLVWLFGWLRVKLSGQDVRFLCRDMFQADLREADVLFLYLIPSVMKKLEQKFQRELKPGTRIVSQSFTLPGHTPVAEAMAGPLHVRLYVWGPTAARSTAAGRMPPGG